MVTVWKSLNTIFYKTDPSYKMNLSVLKNIYIKIWPIFFYVEICVNDFHVKKMIFPGGRKLDKSIKLSRAKDTRLKSNMFSEIKEK